MIGTLDPKTREVTVIGAGISGLLAAHALDKAGYQVTLIEKLPEAGGLIRTHETPHGISEAAAHSVLATDAVRELCSDLGVTLHELRKDSKARYILRGGRMRKIPLNPLEILRLLFRAYFVLADRKAPPERISVAAWARRFLGKPALEYLFTPFVRGIYGSEPDRISVGAAFPMLVVPHGHSLLSFFVSKLRKRNRTPRKKERRVMSSPEGGMGALAKALNARLEQRLGSRFIKGRTVTELPSTGNIVLAVPAWRAAALLTPEDPLLAERLSRVTYTPMVSATVFTEDTGIRGVGVLHPATSGRRVLGVLFNSSSFPGRVKDERIASYTMMMGGSANPELLDASDDEIRQIARLELREVFRSKFDAHDIIINRWPRAIPHYNTALQDAWDAARAGWCATPGHILFGNFAGQVSLRGMIESAASMAAGLHNSV